MSQVSGNNVFRLPVLRSVWHLLMVQPMERDPPEGWVELLTARDWNTARRLGGLVVISDDANDRNERGPKTHHRSCPHVRLQHFLEKVVEPTRSGRRPNG